jgi:hypothetical protein
MILNLQISERNSRTAKNWGSGKRCTRLNAVLIMKQSVQWEVKLKLPLCLNKYHAMKTYWGSGNIATCILNVGTRWRWVVNFTPRLIDPQAKSPPQPVDRRLGGPESWSGRGVSVYKYISKHSHYQKEEIKWKQNKTKQNKTGAKVIKKIEGKKETKTKFTRQVLV